ncbi:MAG: molybdate ABC transporter permease subunit, partial [Acidimicrobiales bacterium]
MGRGGLRTPLPWLGALLLVYLGAPVVYFLYRLATTPARGFHDAGLLPAFWVSLQGATIATAAVTVLGVPLAYLLARRRGPIAAVLGALVMVPLAVPPVMSGILLLYVLGPYTPVGSFFGGHLTTSLVGVVLAQSFVAAPFVVVTTRAAFGAADPTLPEVAATLGHGPWARFLRVELPAAAPGIRAGMVLCWLRAFGEYGATVVVAYHPSSLNVYTYIQFASTGLPGTVAPTALALGVAVAAVAASRLVVVRHRRRRLDTGALPVPRHPDPPAPAPLRFEMNWRLGEFRLSVAH